MNVAPMGMRTGKRPKQLAANWFRYGDPWTAAEERRLIKIYTDPEAKPTRVMWRWPEPRWRTGPSYRASVALGRSPTACSVRAAELMRCRRRKV